MRSLAVISLLALSTLALPKAGSAAGVSVTVKQIDESPKDTASDKDKDKKKKGRETDKESKKLQILLRNVSKTEMPDLKVKFYFFGKEAGDSGYKIIKEGEKTTTVGAGAEATVETELVSVSYTEGGHVGKGADRKRVDPKGQKLTGYGVVVLQGDEVVGEFFSASNYKDLTVPKK